MTGTLAPTIPTIGQPNSTEDVDVKTSLETLRDGVNAILNSDNTVMGMQSYRTIFSEKGVLNVDREAGTYILNSQSGSGLLKSGTEVESPSFSAFYFDDADYVITGKTLKMRLRAQVAVNATKPTINFKVGLYPLNSVAGGADKFSATVGSVVSGSVIEFNEPAASTPAQKEASDFAIPADGHYVLGVLTSGTLTNNSLVCINAQLQVRNV